MVEVVLGAGAPQIPALDFSLASWPRAGAGVGVVDFLMPALAEFQIEPKASPPPDDLVAAGFAEVLDARVDAEAGAAGGAWTEVK